MLFHHFQVSGFLHVVKYDAPDEYFHNFEGDERTTIFTVKNVVPDNHDDKDSV